MSWAAKKHTPLYRYISKLVAVQTNKDGGSLSECLCVDSKVTMKHLSAIASDFDLEKMARDRLKVPWDDVAVKHIRASDALSKRKFVEAFDHQVAMIQAFCRVASAETRWVLQTFYTSCQDLYDLAIAADEQLVRRDEKPLKLEETARIANRVFSVCINDREDNVKASRQWGTYYIANLLFKIYFRLRSHNLCKNVMRAIQAAQPPPLAEFPMSDQVTFNFYLGLLAFRDENYKKADEHLEFALKHCHRGAKRNERVILEYLVPIKMLKGIMPSEALFKRHTELEKTYDPFVAAIRSGNVGAYDQSLVKHQNYLLRRGTYLIMEHIREISIRTLFYKVYVLGGENSRMPIPLFKEALKLADIDVETAEVECILANMIYSNYIKGYLSHQHLMLVLRKQQPFPKVSTTTATIVN